MFESRHFILGELCEANQPELFQPLFRKSPCFLSFCGPSHTAIIFVLMAQTELGLLDRGWPRPCITANPVSAGNTLLHGLLFASSLTGLDVDSAFIVCTMCEPGEERVIKFA